MLLSCLEIIWMIFSEGGSGRSDIINESVHEYCEYMGETCGFLVQL